MENKYLSIRIKSSEAAIKGQPGNMKHCPHVRVVQNVLEIRTKAYEYGKAGCGEAVLRHFRLSPCIRPPHRHKDTDSSQQYPPGKASGGVKAKSYWLNDEVKLRQGKSLQ